MPKIVLSDKAPEKQKRFTLGAEEVSVPFTTEDPAIISNASVHPWLEVEYSKAETAQPGSYVTTLDPKDDVLSAQNSIANDPAEVKKALEARGLQETSRVAIDADLDQHKKVETAGISETVAAANAADTKIESAPASGKKEAK